MPFLNLGIVAHVDAGKTSLTERLLYAGGVLDAVGSVDAGTTRTDSLALERRRGITIKTAVASFPLGDRIVNLIDTPGHPDFIAEVERALRVLDGAVLVISAVEGVQAQTRVLLRTLRRLRVPTLIFVNKIDRAGARYDGVLDEIATRLTPGIVPVSGVRALGTPDASAHPLGCSDPSFTARLVDLSADPHLLAQWVRDETSIPYATLRDVLRSRTHAATVSPVFFGSAVTGAGIDALLHGLTDLLPPAPGDPNGPLTGTVFKIERDRAGSRIAYVRMFNGTLHVRDHLPQGVVTAIEAVTAQTPAAIPEAPPNRATPARAHSSNRHPTDPTPSVDTTLSADATDSADDNRPSSARSSDVARSGGGDMSDVARSSNVVRQDGGARLADSEPAGAARPGSAPSSDAAGTSDVARLSDVARSSGSAQSGDARFGGGARSSDGAQSGDARLGDVARSSDLEQDGEARLGGVARSSDGAQSGHARLGGGARLSDGAQSGDARLGGGARLSDGAQSGDARLSEVARLGDVQRLRDVARLRRGRVDGGARSGGVSAGEIAKVHGLRDVRIGDVIGVGGVGNEGELFAPPGLETVVVAVRDSQRRLLHAALTEMAEQDPLIDLRRDDRRGELAVSLYGEVQKEVLETTLAEEYGIEVVFRESSVLHVERPVGCGRAIEILGKASNPFLATVELVVEPGEPDSDVSFELDVPIEQVPIHLFKTEEFFREALEDTVRRTLGQGLYGWPVVGIRVRVIRTGFTAPMTGAGDYRKLLPLVVMPALVEAGTVVCEPVHRFRLDGPADTLSAVLGLFGRYMESSLVDGAGFVVEGRVPVARLRELELAVPGLTHGEGVLETTFDSYRPVPPPYPTRARSDDNPLDRREYLLRVERRLRL
ncbi:GTP-binding protein [Paractinoplanes lichenicola]|uniref:GTP-binding protein n=1 Tax=Paractinoplanes lichenicola TaxID=2802976 RepID=A0ABS1W6R2_9ACTN|nr:GTP-binding protein [Actinoplanes lichenicola]MBL7262248.1 GTP-binding protein [Actinoplanes lichenicola]